MVAIRSPVEAVISLAQKNPQAQPLTPEFSELMWLIHNDDIFRYLQWTDLAIVNYADWFQDNASII